MTKQTVTVVAGDNLWNIAKHKLGAGHRWPEIYALNRDRIRNPNLIRIGQVFELPDATRAGASDPHPMQRARPRVAPLNGAATARHPTADLGPPPAANVSDPLAQTLVNNTAVRIDLALVPPVTMPVPGGKVKISWTGQIYLWKDGVRPLNTIGNRGLDLQQKHQAATVVGELVESKKLTIGLDRRITYEDLMGFMSPGSNTMVSSGITMSTSSPFPTYRTQIKTKLRQGKFRDWLFVAQEMTINFDVEIDPRQPPAQPPLAQRVPAPAPQRIPAPVPTPIPGHITADVGSSGPSTLQQIGQWTSDHKAQIAMGVLVTATVVFAFLTLGTSTVVEGAALATAGGGMALRAAGS